MTDKEKIELIGKMIGNFWELGTDEAIARGADTLIMAINSVTEFEGGGNT